jgi:hypothetical protein
LPLPFFIEWKTMIGTDNPAISDSRLKRYQAELLAIPPSGSGGCHVALLRVANYGRVAGLAPEQVAQDLTAHIRGTRKVSMSEIESAIRKAFSAGDAPRPKPTIDGAKFLDYLLKLGAGAEEVDLWEASPIRIDWEPEQDAIELLQRLYQPAECLFVGSRFDSGPQHVLTASEWLARFETDQAVPEHIIPNPLSGKPGTTKDGKPTYRADGCVSSFRFAIIEFDYMPRDLQIWFWAAALEKRFPVTALIDSGNRSIHGWLRVDIEDADEWEKEIESNLFVNLKGMGIDAACRNEARLSRLPGHFRTETKRWQRLLYLNPESEIL